MYNFLGRVMQKGIRFIQVINSRKCKIKLSFPRIFLDCEVKLITSVGTYESNW